MSSFFNKLKTKAFRKSGSHEKGQQQQQQQQPASSTTDSPAQTQTQPQPQSQSAEPTFSTQPHPAKTNDPADLQSGSGGGLATSNPMAIHHARDPHVPSQEIQRNLEQPLGREELRARAAELNKPQTGPK
ncbi:hypothetical protein D9615_005417 [Tricholomella constricta]|uniref:Uncharacterized protein n=1 Tax=Tricholomella constricta TaxID=117010 RepID=A0A8H5HE34_9AGAR|nr:hypothetical protein D9615_005417 [Tricholomella constricta]